jgi:hypothetical protein
MKNHDANISHWLDWNGTHLPGRPEQDPRSLAGPRRWTRNLGVGLVLGAAQGVWAVTPTAGIFCNCASLADLDKTASANALSYGFPVGSFMLVSSENMPLSAYYRVEEVRLGIGYMIVAVPITTTLQAANQLDNALYPGRSAKVKQTVGIGPKYTDPVATQQTAIMEEFPIQQTGFGSGHHDGVPDLPTEEYWQFQQRECSGIVCHVETYTVYVGDTIEVEYDCYFGQLCTDYSQTWQLSNVHKVNGQWVPIWVPVKGTLKYRGHPLVPQTNVPAKPITGFGDTVATNSWGGGSITIQWDPLLCWGTTSITITFPDGTSFTSFGTPVCAIP